jgi:hypothetical protein
MMLSDQAKTLGWTAAVLLATALAVCGCSIPIADMHGAGPPKAANGYLPVHDLPSRRNTAVMNPAEQAKIQAELRAAMDRQAATK